MDKEIRSLNQFELKLLYLQLSSFLRRYEGREGLYIIICPKI
jgi:pyrroloquinoline quinone (PQQ) biosynthesis protein C